MLPLSAKTSLVMIELEQEIQTLQHKKSTVLVSQDEMLLHSPRSVGNATESSNKKQTVKQHVHFPVDFEQFHQTLHVLEYTFEEKRKTWLNLDDLDQIKKERRSTIKRMNKGSKLKKGQHTRGLEGYTREGSKVRQKIISDSIAAVKTEQSNQKMDNDEIASQIAQTYGAHSSPCQLAANERGSSDQAAADAADCRNDTDREHETSPSDVATGWIRS